MKNMKRGRLELKGGDIGPEWQKCFVILDESKLLYHQIVDGKTVVGIVKLEATSSVSCSSAFPLELRISSEPDKLLHIRTRYADECTLWAIAISDAIETIQKENFLRDEEVCGPVEIAEESFETSQLSLNDTRELIRELITSVVEDEDEEELEIEYEKPPWLSSDFMSPSTTNSATHNTAQNLEELSSRWSKLSPKSSSWTENTSLHSPLIPANLTPIISSASEPHGRVLMMPTIRQKDINNKNINNRSMPRHRTPGPCHKAPTFQRAPWLTFKRNEEATPPPPPPQSPSSSSSSPRLEEEKDDLREYASTPERDNSLSPSVMRAKQNSIGRRNNSLSSTEEDTTQINKQGNLVVTTNDHRSVRECWRRLGRFSATHDCANESIFLEIVNPLIEQQIESEEDLKSLFHTICHNNTGTLSWQQVREAILTFTSSSLVEKSIITEKSDNDNNENTEQITDPQDFG